MAFPRHTFPLADDPAFDALDIGIAGRLLVRGGAFASQNAEGLGLDLAAAGPLMRVQRAQRPFAAGASGAANSGGAKRQNSMQVTVLKQGPQYIRRLCDKRRRGKAPAAPDDDGQFGDDEKDNGEASVQLPSHLHERCRGNLACALQDGAGRVFVVHAGGDDLHDLDVSRLRPRRRGRTWQLTRVTRVAGSATAPLAAYDMECDTEEGEGEGAGSAQPGANWRPSRLVHITAEAHGDPGELAWIAARSHDRATFYRLCDGALTDPAGTSSAARGQQTVSLSAVGRVCVSNGASASSIVLNPHWGGEAALLDSTGQVYLWSAGSDSAVKVNGPGNDLHAQGALSRAPPYAEAVSTLRRLALDYGQLTWGMHPRTLVCAQAYRLSLLDLRSPASSHQVTLTIYINLNTYTYVYIFEYTFVYLHIHILHT